jgi:hypothetical protein
MPKDILIKRAILALRGCLDDESKSDEENNALIFFYFGHLFYNFEQI